MKLAWPLVALLVVPLWSAQAELQLSPQYRFEVGSEAGSHIAAQIGDVRMGADVPLAVTGSADVDVTLAVRAVDADGVATVAATFGAMTSELMGRSRDVEPPEPVELRVDRLGRVVGASGGGADVDLFASGGIPVQVVVVLAGIVELPDHPVGVGESWTTEHSQQVPDLGEATVRTTSRLESVDGEVATIVTDIEASFPDFAARNPLQDNDITVRNGALSIEGMRRTIDVRTGLTRSAEADMAFDCTASVGGLADLPLSVTSSFDMQPLVAGAAQARVPDAPAPLPRRRLPSTAEWVVRALGKCIGDAVGTVLKQFDWL